MTNWGTQSLQFVWFLSSVEGLDGAKLFSALWGTEPDLVQRNKVPSPTNPVLSLASSEENGIASTVQIQPGRIDVVLSLNDLPFAEGSAPLMQSKTALADLGERISQMPSLSNVLRLSVVANEMAPVDGYAEAMSLIGSETGFDPNIGEISDFMIQLNRKKFSQIDEDMQINRIVRYQVTALQYMNIDGLLNRMSNTQPPVALSALRNLDFNTVPNGLIISEEKQRSLIAELISEVENYQANKKLSALEAVS